MSRIRAVLFDLGGTLIRTADHAEIFRRILRANGVERSLDEIARAHEEAEKEMSRETEEYAQLAEEFWNRWNGRILEFLGVEENRECLARKLTTQWFDYSDVELYPDVWRALSQLKEKGVKVALVTNGLQSDVEAILPRVGLKDYFDLTVASDTVGKPKPDTAIFAYALKRLGVEAEEALCVGDDLEKDCEAAAKIGIRALLIDRKDRVRTEANKIRDLREVVALVEGSGEAEETVRPRRR